MRVRRDTVTHLDGLSAGRGQPHVTRRPPPSRGVRVRVPSCASAMLLTMASPSPTPAWSRADAAGAALERLGEGRDQLRVSGSPVFSTTSSTPSGAHAGGDPHRAGRGQVVDDRVVDEVRRQLQEQRVRAEGRRDVAVTLESVTPRSSASGSSVSAASSAASDRSTGSRVNARWSLRLSSEQRLGQVDRAGVDGVQLVDELVGRAARVLAGDVEQGLRDRQRRAQLVRGVGGEPLLLGVVGLEPREHGVEVVGQLAELVGRPLQHDPVRERPAPRPGGSRG